MWAKLRCQGIRSSKARVLRLVRLALLAWAELYNREWLIGGHGFKPPAAARQAFHENRQRLAA